MLHDGKTQMLLHAKYILLSCHFPEAHGKQYNEHICELCTSE